MIANNAIFNAGTYSCTIAGDVESNGTLNGGTSLFTMTAADAQVNRHTDYYFL